MYKEWYDLPVWPTRLKAKGSILVEKERTKNDLPACGQG